MAVQNPLFRSLKKPVLLNRMQQRSGTASMRIFFITMKRKGWKWWRCLLLRYKITTLIDFNSPVLGTQHAGLKHIQDFKEEIAPCRTFCFLHELEMLLDNNLIKGGDVNNAIVVVDKAC